METDEPEGGQVVALLAVGAMFVFGLIAFFRNLAVAHGAFEVLLVIATIGVAVGLQIYFLPRIKTQWTEMSPGMEWKIGIAGVLVPPLAAFLGIVIIALALLAFMLGGFAEVFNKSAEVSANPTHRDNKDRYGNRVGSFDTTTGTLKDRYGNRTGSIDRQTGLIKDKYGNNLGSID